MMPESSIGVDAAGESLESRTTLTPEAESAAVARAFVTETLLLWGAERMLESATLLTSELVTNAVLYAGSDIQLIVRQSGRRIRVEVRDGNPQVPVRRFPTEESVSGRGLALVEALAAAWGVDRVPHDGKTVWFEVAA
jgi:anti-sigma regulatory factor (Ser/Thr protein kinase)